MMKEDAFLDVLLTNKEELFRDVKVNCSLGSSGHEMVEFKILQGGSGAESRITRLVFRRAGEQTLAFSGEQTLAFSGRMEKAWPSGDFGLFGRITESQNG